MASLARKIKEIRQSLGLNQTEFADALGYTQSAISRWEAETNPSYPGGDALIKIANLANCDIGELTAAGEFPPMPQGGSGPRAKIIGELQAGAWRESIEWPPDEQIDVWLPISLRAPELAIAGFLVSGTSMNLRYPDGSVVFAVPTIALGIEPEAGDTVIVQRRDAAGMIEGTLKELRIGPAGDRWLWPHSSDPEHQSPIPLHPKAGKAEEIQISGIVVAGFVLEPAALARLRRR